ncbi:hypothetical protein F4779DRAFT_578420 [Xylariaceae sp. FL0662B]|nr:hypothetical protein F4779DRAFT_578420 [Xylariaceae sp. FL0662B]
MRCEIVCLSLFIYQLSASYVLRLDIHCFCLYMHSGNSKVSWYDASVPRLSRSTHPLSRMNQQQRIDTYLYGIKMT